MFLAQANCLSKNYTQNYTQGMFPTGLKVQMSPSRTVNISSNPVPLVISNFLLVKYGGGMAVKEATVGHLAVSAKDEMLPQYLSLTWDELGKVAVR